MIDFFKRLFKLNRKGYTKIVDVSSEFESKFSLPQKVKYESDSIAQISEATFIDTTDDLNIAKYKNNLRLLEEQTIANNSIADFMIIRNDDFLPDDWIWRVASADTNVEYGGFSFTYNMRMELASKIAGNNNNDNQIDILIPQDEKKIYEILSNIDKDYAAIYRPIHFRSTKHFTINTPLEYTGTYNNVSSNRKFYIIDTINNFANSGYGYSADYHDAYLDVTHEGLEISSSAVVLIDEKDYDNIMADEKIKKQLSERRVIVYRGSASLAINMYLSENGILPSKPGQHYQYRNETINILEESMKRFCSTYDLLYSQGHGNLFGKGGHFTDNLDNEKHEHLNIEVDFLNFLRTNFPNYNFSNTFFKDDLEMRKFIKTVGIDNVVSLIDNYNRIVYDNANNNLIEYKRDRATITPEISNIFKITLRAIKKYYATNEDNTLSVEERNELFNLIKVFFHSNKVNNQLLAATMICQRLNVEINSITNEASSIYS